MSETLKQFLERTTFLGTIAKYRRRKRTLARIKKNTPVEMTYQEWKEKGARPPMPHIGKQMVLKQYAKQFGTTVFVETGTCEGQMVNAMLDQFKEIFSIEIDDILFNISRKKFEKYNQVHIMHGDSDELLPEILQKITQPSLFWLDAHYSGKLTSKADLNTPIIRELMHILAHPTAEKHVILIDDSRDFTGKNDYPTLDEVRKLILKSFPNWVFKVKDDIIRAHAGQV